MADDAAGALEFDDAKLLGMVRAGDGSAFGVLCQRHSAAAHRLARELVVSPAEVDAVVAETFARIQDVLQRVGGPADGFRPYLLTMVRRVCLSRTPGGLASIAADDQARSDPGRPFLVPDATGTGGALMVRAYMSLPERWSTLLWHTEIEQDSPDDVAPLFGLSGIGFAALERRARDSLRQAYLEMHIARVTRQDCILIAGRLGAFVRFALSAHETDQVSAHLGDCDECRTSYAELADLGVTLRSLVTPMYLGSAAASYLASGGSGVAAGTVAIRTGAQVLDARGAFGGDTAVLAAAGGQDRPGRPLRVSRRRRLAAAGDQKRPRLLARWSRRQRWLAAGFSAALVAIATTAFAVSLAGHGGAPHPGSSGPQPLAGAPVAAATAGQQHTTAHSRKSAPAPRAANRQSAAASPTPAGGSGPSSTQPPSASASPGGPAGPSPTAVQLAASIDVYGGGSGNAVQVTFRVTDAGSAATGGLTAAIGLPAGSSMFTGWGNHNADHGWGGWSCQPVSSGASCQHSALSAGTDSWGSIWVQLTGSAACGQYVQLTASSGSASTSAQSAQGIPCGGPGGDVHASANAVSVSAASANAVSVSAASANAVSVSAVSVSATSRR
jgi:DNA-directed RNA polymerase specialized sigma24 family protein